MLKRTKFMRLSPLVTLLVLVLAIIALPGCLRGKYKTYLRYDRATDSMKVMVVFEDIYAEKESDSEHLVKNWKTRDNLMMLPVPGIPWGGPITLLRGADDSIYNVALHEGGSEPMFLTKSRLPLSEVDIQPGRLSVSADGRLGYWQSLSCSGQFIDKAIASLIERYTPEVLEMIEIEMKRRIEAIDQPPSNRSESGMYYDALLRPLDDLSLARLRAQFENKQIAVKRDGGVFTLAFQVSPDDAQELLKAAKQIEAPVDATSDKAKAEDVFEPYSDRVDVQADATGWVRVTFDLTRTVVCEAKDAKKGDDQAYKAMVDYARAQGLDVARTFDIQTLIDRFNGIEPTAPTAPTFNPWND